MLLRLCARSLFNYRHQRPPVASRHVGFGCYRVPVLRFWPSLRYGFTDQPPRTINFDGTDPRRKRRRKYRKRTLARAVNQLTHRTCQERESERRLHSSSLSLSLSSSSSFPLVSGHRPRLPALTPSPAAAAAASRRCPRLRAANPSRSAPESPETVSCARWAFLRVRLSLI